jgi:hypothetical protein
MEKPHAEHGCDPGRRLPWLPVLAALALANPAQAGSKLIASAGSIEFRDVTAGQVEIIIAPVGTSGLEVRFYSGEIDGLESLGRLEGISLACAQLSTSEVGVECARGRLSGDFGEAGKQDAALAFGLDAGGTTRFAFDRLSIAGGNVALKGQQRGDDWSIDATINGVSIAELGAIASLRDALPGGLQAEGSVSGPAMVTGHGRRLDHAEALLQLLETGFTDESGALAGEQLHGKLGVSIDRSPSPVGWSVSVRLYVDGGQAYLEPVFLDLGEYAAEADFDAFLTDRLDALTVHRFAFHQTGVGATSGTAELDLVGETLLRQVRVRLEEVNLDGLVGIYLRPFLISTQFADLAGSGQIHGEVDLDAGLPSRLELELEDATLDSPTGSLSVEALAGHFSWFDEQLRNDLAPQVDSALFKSRLAWRAARLWGIEFGPAEIPFTTTGRHFRLLDPVLLPVFDGSVAIETLRLRHAGTPQMYVRFDAELRPVSIALIGRALGWPEFSGTISGRIPRLELANGLVTLGGNLEAQVFDGTITLRGLRMRDPLGQYPQLYADIDIEGLDLERVTDTFEFGLITGRLSGQVRGLEMFDWMPAAFDASVYSTPGDRSPRRISQRAVSNLSSIGGGSGGSVAAALQSGFLRFFDSFRYDRLGLSCRLVNDVCLMDGVAPAPNGYYIVKGSGLPRIDVIASQRRVAWTRLVRQLAAMTESAGPVIE